MQIYKNMLETVMQKGVEKSSGRDIADTISYFNYNYQHDLADGFPLLTTKKMPFKTIMRELLWFISGEKSINGWNLPFWKPWADKETGEVPSPYGFYWRSYPTGELKLQEIDERVFLAPVMVDQLQNVIDTLMTNPYSRRMVVLAWEPGNAWQSELPPCHYTFAFHYNGRLNLHLTQRSGDVPIGIPFNLASYAALLHIVANITGLEPGVFAHTIIDAHIYKNQIDGIKEQMEREPLALPQFFIKRKLNSLDDISIDDFAIENYQSHEKIKLPVEV